MIDDMTYSEQINFIARVKVLLDKTAAWERGELDIMDAPKLPERTRRRLERKVLVAAWDDVMKEAEQYKP